MISLSLVAAVVAAGGTASAGDRDPAAFAEKVLWSLAVDRRDREPGLMQWAYGCLGHQLCAGDCADTLKALGGLLSEIPYSKSLCSEFSKAVHPTKQMELDELRPLALAWVKSRVKKTADNIRPRLGTDDRIVLACRLAQLDLGGDVRGCAQGDAIITARWLSRWVKDPQFQNLDAIWTRFCFEVESCGGECAKHLGLLTMIDPSAASQIPMCGDSRAFMGDAKANHETWLRFGKQRAAKYVVSAAKLLDATRGQQLRCDAARLQLIPAEPKCGP